MTHREFARDRSAIPRYIFVGRLVPEKGFDVVISVARELLHWTPQRALLEIYGRWPMEHDLLARLSGEAGFFDARSGDAIPAGTRVAYFGHVSSASVREALGRSHYMLMPSKFLETFGLSALEAIELGVPLIGFDQGGLSQFLLSEHRVSSEGNWNSRCTHFTEMVDQTTSRFSGVNWRRQSLSVQDIAARYTPDAWFRELIKNAPTNARSILMLSDYGAPIGGIETHIESISEVLRFHSFEVSSLFGMWGNSRMLRYIGLLFSWFNIGYAFRLWIAIAQKKPDIIWIHSEVRKIGPIGLLPLRWYQGVMWKTYHDLGYFWAFPTEFTSQKQLDTSSGFKAFFLRSRLASRLAFFPILAKYIQIAWIRSYLEQAALHIVPSEFMRNVVERFAWKKGKVIVLGHFSTTGRFTSPSKNLTWWTK